MRILLACILLLAVLVGDGVFAQPPPDPNRFIIPMTQTLQNWLQGHVSFPILPGTKVIGAILFGYGGFTNGADTCGPFDQFPKSSFELNAANDFLTGFGLPIHLDNPARYGYIGSVATCFYDGDSFSLEYAQCTGYNYGVTNVSIDINHQFVEHTFRSSCTLTNIGSEWAIEWSSFTSDGSLTCDPSDPQTFDTMGEPQPPPEVGAPVNSFKIQYNKCVTVAPKFLPNNSTRYLGAYKMYTVEFDAPQQNAASPSQLPTLLALAPALALAIFS